MDIGALIQEISNLLTETFGQIDHWFDREENLRTYQPEDGGWTIDQILEHIALTNHFLLILIDKGAAKALQNGQKLDLEATVKDYTFHPDKLDEVGQHQSFAWIRPEHMDPKGEKPPHAVREELKIQLDRCLTHLDVLKNGAGVLYKTTMSVNDLGKIDVYEYIYFLAQHGKRHLAQMAKNEMAWNAGH